MSASSPIFQLSWSLSHIQFCFGALTFHEKISLLTIRTHVTYSQFKYNIQMHNLRKENGRCKGNPFLIMKLKQNFDMQYGTLDLIGLNMFVFDHNLFLDTYKECQVLTYHKCWKCLSLVQNYDNWEPKLQLKTMPMVVLAFWGFVY